MLPFHAHEVGDWTGETLPGTEIEHWQRDHSLTFVGEHIGALLDEAGAVLGTVNADDFLGAAPGHLMCMSLTVSKVVRTDDPPETEDTEAIIEEAQHLWWRLDYRLVELASTSWNELIHRVPGAM
jgi:hypothetical protein